MDAEMRRQIGGRRAIAMSDQDSLVRLTLRLVEDFSGEFAYASLGFIERGTRTVNSGAVCIRQGHVRHATGRAPRKAVRVTKMQIRPRRGGAPEGAIGALCPAGAYCLPSGRHTTLLVVDS